MNLRLLGSTVRLQMKQSFSRPMFRFTLIAGPVLNTILLYEMFLSSGEENFFSYVVLGAGLMGIWGCICFSSAGDINRERYMGTLALIFAAPAPFRKTILGKIIGNTLLSLLTFLVSLLTAVILFGVKVRIAEPSHFLVAFAVTIVSFISISSVIACVLTLSRKTELYMNMLELPIALLCGFVFPLELLPPFIRVISYALSPTWAVRLLRRSVEGGTEPSLFAGELLVTLALSAAYAILSLLLYRMIEKHVRIRATLDVA